ncbi:MAG: protein kinase [Prevotella sp.]|nr:protein kinase [Prevotella sp.]
MSALNNGATLNHGKYTIVKMLGQGAFGITYLAETPTSLSGELGNMDVNVYVTVKEFFMSTMNNRSSDCITVERTDSSLVRDYKRKFIREAEKLSRLQHENIVKVLEVFEENNTAYYVMEYLDGGTVDDFIRANGKLSPAQTVEIIRQVCSALQYMHGNRMLHLDLKPKNIMLTSTGKVKLIDFGLSKQYNENGEPEESTSIGLGTPGYAPIEQATYRQDGSLPVTLDIYALGATMYKMLTGVVPPDSSLVLNDGLPLQPLWQARLPQQLMAIVSKAMAPTMRNRYQTVAEIDTLLAGMTTEELTIPEEETTLANDEGQTVIDSVQQVADEKPPIPPPSYDPYPPIPRPKPTKWWKVIAIISSVLALGLIGLLIVGLTSKNDNSSNNTSTYIATDSVEEVQSSTDEYKEDEIIQADEEEKEVAEDDDFEYEFDSYYLTESDLEGMSKSDLELLRNYIYAWHGYRFKRDDLANFFQQCPWYYPRTSDADAVWNSFNDVERYNVKFIKNHE